MRALRPIAFVGALATFITCVGASPASADTAPSDSPSFEHSLGVNETFSSDLMPITELAPTKTVDFHVPSVNEAKNADPEGFNAALSIVQSSPEIQRFFSQRTSDVDGANQQLAALAGDAANATQIKDRFTGKKMYEAVDGSFSLVDEATPIVSNRSWPRCGKAWAALWAYFAAQTMTCRAVEKIGGGVGAAAGIICDGVFMAIGTLPDFNAKC